MKNEQNYKYKYNLKQLTLSEKQNFGVKKKMNNVKNEKYHTNGNNKGTFSKIVVHLFR